MARDRYAIVEPERPHFVTCTVVDWIPVFTRPWAVEILLQSLRHLHEHDSLEIYGYVVMENHLHMVIAAPDLPGVIRRFKSFTARAIIDRLVERGEIGILTQLRSAKLDHKSDRDYQLWQEGSHPIAIESESIMRQKLDYMHQNPVRRGYVEDPAHWRHSSAGVYAGSPVDGLVRVTIAW